MEERTEVNIDAQKMSLTPLMMAARDGNLWGLEEHLGEAGKQDENGWTALMWAAINGNSDCAQLLLSEAGKQGNDGETALMMAAASGHTNCARLLLSEAGKQGNDGETALMMAAASGHTNCVRFLLSEVGNQSTEEWDGSPPGTTAFLISLQEGHVECARLLASEAAVREKNGQLHIERIQRVVWEEWADSPLAETYRAVADDLEKAIIRYFLRRFAPHHISALLPPIDWLFEDEDAQELGEAIWSALFGEPGAFEELDDVFCEIEDEMVGTCAVCLLHQKNVVLLPCRHLVICEECADRIDYRCPYCRTIVDETIVIEYPEGLDQ